MATKPLVVIVGPTASGKTSLAIDLAKKYNGEIISADSRAVYRGIDIGTAKPTKSQRKKVPHWGLDLVDPDKKYTVVDFKQYVTDKIRDIRSRGGVPFLVGGSGLYIDSVILDYQFKSATNPKLRQKLSAMDVQELKEYCIKHNIILPSNEGNRRHLIRAIETEGEITTSRKEPGEDTIVVGISTDKSDLTRRIEGRVEQMLKDGIVDEAKRLGKKYGWEVEPMRSNIYPLVHDYLEGKINTEELVDKAVIKDRQLVKKQTTWFKRDKFIRWMSVQDAKEYLLDKLQA